MRGVLIGVTLVVLVLIILPLLFMAMMMAGMMGFGGMSGGMGQLGPIPWPSWLMLIFGFLVVAGLVMLIVWGTRRLAGSDGNAARETPLAILQLRYAQGEIGRDEYEAARQILLRDGDNR